MCASQKKSGSTRIAAALLTVLTLFLNATTHAHETWILPSAFSVAPGSRLEVGLSTGSLFPTPQIGTAPDDVTYARLRQGGRQGDQQGDRVTEITERSMAHHVLQLRGPVLNHGVAVVYARLPATQVQLSLTQVAQYFDEIQATREVRAQWAGQRRQQATWTESFTKQAKTCIRVAGAASTPPTAHENCQRPVGLPLEIVPLQSPFDLRAGQSMQVRLLWQGKPLAGASVGSITEPTPDRTFATTDAQGVAHIPLARAGRTLIFSVYLRPTDTPGHWLSDFSTLTVQVAERTP